MTEEKTYIYGKHAVAEAVLYAPHCVREVYLSPTVDDTLLREKIKKAGIMLVSLNSKNKPKGISDEAVHQGAIASIVLDNLLVSYNNFIKNLDLSKKPALVLLDELQDPQNVGAIIRSAVAFGISGVLIPQHNQVGITATVIKVSAGMVFRIPIINIGNINNTLEDLKKTSFWIYGLEGEGQNSLTEEKFGEPTVFVLGSEGKGIRLKTKEHCDILLSIPVTPECESLNVATSAGVVFYEWKKQQTPI